MSKAKAAKFFVVAFFSDEEQIDASVKSFKKKLGKLDYQSPIYSLSAPPGVQFIERRELDCNYKVYSFYRLISREELPYLSEVCTKLESNNFSENTKTPKNRFVKLIPGYLTLSHAISARDTETFGRLYLFHGIFGQIELVYEGGSFRPSEFANPEFLHPGLSDHFITLRKMYKEQLKKRYGKIF